MKNTITNFALVLAAFVAVNLLMSFARPTAADEPKQYIIVRTPGTGFSDEAFQKAVNQKLAEGWHLQGGVANSSTYAQAMVK